MNDDQILVAAKAINAKRKLSEYHKELYRKVVSLVNDTDPDVSHKPLTIREQSSLTIKTFQVTDGHYASVELRLDSDLAKDMLESLENILSKRTKIMGTKPTRGPAAPMSSHSAMLAAKIIKEKTDD